MAHNDITISAFEFFQRFPDERAAIEYIESRRWPDGVATCPRCEGTRTTRAEKDFQYHHCNDCRKRFTVRQEPSLNGRIFRWTNGCSPCTFSRPPVRESAAFNSQRSWG